MQFEASNRFVLLITFIDQTLYILIVKGDEPDMG